MKIWPFFFPLVLLSTVPSAIAAPPTPPLPTPQQVAWQRLETTMMISFGMNTFTDREWGEGNESPQLFNPSALDAYQWVQSAKDAGLKMIVLVAKHHDGFCLWPSKYTERSVKNSPWKNGKGDVVREFTDACHAEGMKVGLYLSPWDRNNPTYGTPAYNDYFDNQLKELLSHYGPVDEIWFDGANGEGPNGKKQNYDWERFYATIHRLMPQALIAIAGPDIRWVGNESGIAPLGETSVQPTGNTTPEAPSFKWYPSECDVSIRPGWFYHAGDDSKIKSLAELVDLYFKSVGRNSVFLLNVPPDKRGLLPELDVARLREFGKAVRGINENSLTRLPSVKATASASVKNHGPNQVLDASPGTYWTTPSGSTTAALTIDLGAEREFNTLSVGEALTLGERVRRYHIDAEQNGTWQTLASGTVIGQRNLYSVSLTKARRLRLVIESARDCPAIASFAATLSPVTPPALPLAAQSLTQDQPVTASNFYNPTFSPEMAVDGNPATRWGTSDETRACWLEVDLGQGRHFNRVAISELDPRITRFELQYKFNPNDPWQTAFTGTSAGLHYDQTFPAVMGRYVRLNILEASAPPTLWEFNVYAVR